jgi:hypothetical protein
VHLLAATAVVTLVGCAAAEDQANSGGSASDQPVTTTAGGGPTCDSLIAIDQATQLFDGITAVQVDDELGTVGGATVSCVYETPDEGDVDAATHLLQFRVWPGSQYHDPDLTYPGHEDLVDLGDDAFVSADGSVAAGYVQGDVTVTIDYSVIDLSSEQPAAPAKKDQVVALLRQLHERLG